MHHVDLTTRRSAPRGRRGAMLIEMLVAGILLTTVIVLVLSLIHI